MTKFPVTLPIWLIQDGAVPLPAIGDTASYCVAFAPASESDLPELLVRDQSVAARTIRGSDDRGFSVELDFSEFTATTTSARPMRGQIAVTGRLFVEYELAPTPASRLTGVVRDRQLLVEDSLMPSDPKDIHLMGPPVNQELSNFDPAVLRLDSFAAPVLGTVWSRPTGLLLTVAHETT